MELAITTNPYAFNGCFAGKDQEYNIRGGRWYSKRGTPKEEFCICQYCYDNGCYDKSELETFDASATMCITCDCKNMKQHSLDSENNSVPIKFHPQLKMWTCIGSYGAGNASWYRTLNVDPQTKKKKMICQYCAEHGCMPADCITKLRIPDTMQYDKYVCQCQNNHAHMVPIICPKCTHQANIHDQVSTQTANEHGLTPSSSHLITTCVQCQCEIPKHQSICMRCSNKYHWCMICRDAIHAASEYLKICDSEVSKELYGNDHIAVFQYLFERELANCKCGKAHNGLN